MGTIETVTGPHELTLDGELVCHMQADPTATDEYFALLKARWSMKDEKAIRKSITDLTEALAGLAQTPDDGDQLRKFVTERKIGVPTLRSWAVGYIGVVTGFPTQPSNGSKRS